MEMLLKPGILYVTAIVGMFTHFLKQNVKGETATAIGDYFKDNLKSTLVALVATSVGFVGYYFELATGAKADFVAVFLIGFLCDSLLNKWSSAAPPDVQK